MDNVTFQPSLFKLKSDIKLKEYQETIERLGIIDHILLTTNTETNFISGYLNKMLLKKQKRHNNFNLTLTGKEKNRYTDNASEAIRCNILAKEFKIVT
jgi:Tfp pilus assembly major pilin PilA